MSIINDERLNSATVVSMIENRPPVKVRRLAASYPEENTYDLDVVFNEINSVGIKAGSIVGFDAATPLRDKGQLKTHMASLTKITGAYNYTEKELLKYNKPRDEKEKEALVKGVLRSVADLAEGNEDTKELLRAQMTYSGRLDYEDSKTNVKIQFDYDLPEEGKVERDIYSNPLENLQAEAKAFSLNNNRVKADYMVMNSSTLEKLKRNDIVRQNIHGDTPRMVLDTEIENLFRELKLPELVIDDEVTVIEGIEGDKIVEHMEDDKVVFHSANLGTTFIGPSVEKNYDFGTFVKSVPANDPEGEKTIVGIVAMPVIKNLKGVRIVNIVESEEVPEG